jgi:NAD(P)-dependent dehydrogenase (short-subunit alcohol dehydrogenase family)
METMGLLEGKVAVISGAGSGMGKASVELFAGEGAKVVALDVSGAEQDTAKPLGKDVVAAHCDMSKEADVAAAFDLAMSTFGRVDAVLNVAGISGTPTPLHELAVDDFDAVMAVNLRGVFLGTKYGVRSMLAGDHGGAIVNWSSIGGTLAGPYAGAYCTSKAGVNGVTRSTALDYGPNGIRANAVCPGIAMTPMVLDTVAQNPDLPQKPPIGRGSTPEEVAEVAVFLCSDRGVYVTGAIIPVDGGWSIKLAF